MMTSGRTQTIVWSAQNAPTNREHSQSLVFPTREGNHERARTHDCAIASSQLTGSGSWRGDSSAHDTCDMAHWPTSGYDDADDIDICMAHLWIQCPWLETTGAHEWEPKSGRFLAGECGGMRT